MAETPGIANKKLLLVALVLGAIVVVLYNLQIASIRRASKGETVQLLRLRNDMQAGEKIKEDDLDVVEVEKSAAESLGDVVTADRIGFAATSALNQPVLRNRWLMYSQINTREGDSPSARLGRGLVTHTIVVDSQRAPGEILHIGDRVNVLGMLAVKNRPLQAYRIIENLKVVEIGGKSYQEPTGTGARRSESPNEGMRQYQKISVEVTPEVAVQLANVLSHVQGKLWIEVRNPTDRGPNPQIAPELADLAASAAAPPGSPAAMGGADETTR